MYRNPAGRKCRRGYAIMGAMPSIKLRTLLKIVFTVLFGTLLLAQSALAPGNEFERVRAFTRMIEFDYVDWSIDALLLKNLAESASAPRYMSVEDQRRVVYEYIELVRAVDQADAEVKRVYADPSIQNPEESAAAQNERLAALKQTEASLKPIAESILQYQVSTAAVELGLGMGGQPIPPVLYHSTRLPSALIVSPRTVIRQDANISLQPDMTTAETAALEDRVENALDVSALVVPIGGVGTYPTMVMSTTDLVWLLEVVAHEWTHNFLTLRPVGALYMASGEMRTINETAANISGKEIGRAVVEQYYPELIQYLPEKVIPSSEPAKEAQAAPAPTPTPEDPNAFNFNREMHATRVQVDALLAAGEVDAAEKTMEERRQFFWENGYQIRKLNQAYFAFYGAYNDAPGGGAGGQDPIGPAVQDLRRRSDSLASFLNRLSWVTSFEALQGELARLPD